MKSLVWCDKKSLSRYEKVWCDARARDEKVLCMVTKRRRVTRASAAGSGERQPGLGRGRQGRGERQPGLGGRQPRSGERQPRVPKRCQKELPLPTVQKVSKWSFFTLKTAINFGFLRFGVELDMGKFLR